MPKRKAAEPLALIAHGAAQLPSVTVDAYNAELRSADGFIGDRASKRAFLSLLDDWRERAYSRGDDPLGNEPTETLSKKDIEKALLEGDPEAAGVVHGAVEDFSQEFAAVIRRLRKLKQWAGVERIVVGGGFRNGRVGELAIGRTLVLLKASGLKIDIRPIHHHPDEAGLIGAAHLAPPWTLSGHDCVLAIDIGGSNFRVGIVETRLNAAADLSEARIAEKDLWRYREEKPTREAALKRLAEMLNDLVANAEKEKRKLSPFIGVGCPGLIEQDGSIKRGGQNLPGNWSGKPFHLPTVLAKAVPKIGAHRTVVVMHNDAVVQGLSERPFTGDVKRWGVLTIGTGLGNACFSNLEAPPG
jgi:predicted NBD/HSP70 family sugar kinase